MDSEFTEDVSESDRSCGRTSPPLSGAGTALEVSLLSEQGALIQVPAVTSFTHLKKVPSFAEPSRTSTMRSVTIILDRPGPLLMQLKMHASRKCVVLHGFDRDEDGERGELELSGKLRVGDLLIDINGKSLERKSFKEVLRLIRNEGVSGGPRVLSLIRFSCPISEADYFGHGEGTLKDSGCYSSSEIAEDLGQYIMGLLSREQIDLDRLRRIATRGLPAVDGARALVWMLLLGYLPNNRYFWDATLKKNRTVYASLKEELKICPSHGAADGEEPEDLIAAIPPDDGGGGWRRCAQTESDMPTGLRMGVSDDPLQIDRNSSHWARYFEDRELLDSVEKDVLRTYPEHEFFDDGAKIALKAILFIYGKLNPGVSYVQGMNELAGTLYFVFANNKLSRDWIDNAEADTFFCFTALMSEFQDLFIYRLDDTSRGLQGTIERYCQLLAAEDPHLHEELCNQGLEATFYTVRWVTTLFSREFDLLDTIRLWDSLFADADQHEFLSFMCYTMTAEQRDFIFANEFADNLKMLQSYPLKDVPHLLQMLEGTRSAVRNNIPRNPPRHPLKPDAKVDHAESSGSYFSSTGRQLIYDQLRNVDAEAIKVTSYQLLSNSINRIISTAGNALDAYNNSNFNDGSEFEDAVSSPGIDELNGPTFCRANVGSDLPTSSVVKTTQETAANASKWTWQGIGNLMSLAVQASAQLSKNITPEPVSGDNAEIIMASTIDPPLE